MDNTVISAADILLPPYSPDSEKWQSYSVIACDQFTSEPEYWEKVTDIAGGELSCLGLILPEAYLETEKEAEQKALVRENMRSARQKLSLHKNCLVYIERTLPSGKVRPGLVAKLDLEAYDFSPESSSTVRATEETVIERIPPRVAVRREATVELPHVMVFANDKEGCLLRALANRKGEMTPLYSFPLMLDGGYIKGYKIEGDLLSEVEKTVKSYENGDNGGLAYAMGDGNHSLASAKSHFEQLKAEIGEEKAMSHPARYALVEVVDLYDPSIVFEPIYRLLVGASSEALLAFAEKMGEGIKEKQNVILVENGEKREVSIPRLHALTVGSLQMIIDEYLKICPSASCDYIHGVESLESLAREKGSFGFLFEGIAKEELFSYVCENGTLPRKTFSMGTAAEKRYYLEARSIVL